jgi:hypothetical protein
METMQTDIDKDPLEIGKDADITPNTLERID